MERERAENAARIEQVEEEYKEKERRLNSRLKDQMNQLIQQQMQEIQSMQQDFAQASELMDEKYK